MEKEAGGYTGTDGLGLVAAETGKCKQSLSLELLRTLILETFSQIVAFHSFEHLGSKAIRPLKCLTLSGVLFFATLLLLDLASFLIIHFCSLFSVVKCFTVASNKFQGFGALKNHLSFIIIKYNN